MLICCILFQVQLVHAIQQIHDTLISIHVNMLYFVPHINMLYFVPGSIGTCYTADSRYFNILPTTGIRWTMAPVCLSACLSLCNSRNECWSVFYHKQNTTCHGYGARLHDSIAVSPHPGLMYLEPTGKTSWTCQSPPWIHVFGTYR